MRWVAAQPVVNMYSAPTLDADVVSQATYGTTVQQTEPKEKSKAPDDWMYIKTPDDYPGWVQRSYFLPLDVNENQTGTTPPRIFRSRLRNSATGSFLIERSPGRLFQRISDGSTASLRFGQRVNSACKALAASIRAS